MSNAAIVSIQVGLPAEHGADTISKKSWESGIFKAPVEGRLWLDELNFKGDGQQDLQHHGGPFRAVLGYGAAHYPVWRDELNLPYFPYGAFGENLTISELTEDEVCLGDIYAVGETRLQVAQPRQPCWKLARRWQIKDLAARVEARGWGGWYHRVLQTGFIATGDSYERVERLHPQFPISRLNDLVTGREISADAYHELIAIEELSTDWRNIFTRFAEQV